MSITKYDYTCLQQNLISGLSDFLTPLWNWTKVETSKNLDYTYGVQAVYIRFYVDNSTYLEFVIKDSNSTYAFPMFQIVTISNTNAYVSRFDYDEINLYCINSTYKAKIRFTKVGTNGFFLGMDFNSDTSPCGNYSIPLIMCCNLGNGHTLIHNSIKITKNTTTLTMPSPTSNKIFYDGMNEYETVSLTRKVTDDVEQLIPICTNTGLYSTNGFTPFVTYNNTLTPHKFTLGGKQYYGNGLMVLLDE